LWFWPELRRERQKLTVVPSLKRREKREKKNNKKEKAAQKGRKKLFL
jgi:hypothetical protein